MGRQEATLITPEQGLLLEVTTSMYRLTDYRQLVPWLGYNVHQVRLEAAGVEEKASHLVFCFPNPPTLRCCCQYLRNGFRVLTLSNL